MQGTAPALLPQQTGSNAPRSQPQHAVNPERGAYPFGGYASYWPEFLKHKQFRGLSENWSRRQLESRE